MGAMHTGVDNITAELLAFSAGTTGRPGPDVT